MIKLSHITKLYKTNYSQITALNKVDLNVRTGDFSSIMGPSGSGKSTLLNIIGMLDRFDSGQYFLEGTDVNNLNEFEMAKVRGCKIGFVFQSFNLIPTKTALENVALPLYYQNVPKKVRLEQAEKQLDKMKLLEWAHHKPDQLSGGQKQRVAIARALVTKPAIILADEPTGALDSGTSVEIMRIIKEINQAGITVLIVTHDLNVANVTDKIILLEDGKITKEYKPKTDLKPENELTVN